MPLAYLYFCDHNLSELTSTNSPIRIKTFLNDRNRKRIFIFLCRPGSHFITVTVRSITFLKLCKLLVVNNTYPNDVWPMPFQKLKREAFEL